MARPLIIVCDWIPPAFGAVGQYQLAAATEAASGGRPTTLIGLGSEPSVSVETVAPGRGTLTIVRLKAKPAQKVSLLKRAMWAIRTNMALMRAMGLAAKQAGVADIKVTGSPPFLSYLVLTWAKIFRRHRIIYRITDFYPETVFAAGKASWLKPFVPIIHGLRRGADQIEAISLCQKHRLLESGVDESAIEIIRDDAPVEFGAHTRPAPRPFGAEKVILLYSGNLGVAHDVETFAEAYRRHIQDGADGVRLWLNATGVGVDALSTFCREHKLPVHRTAPAPIEELAGILLTADAHLVTLKQPFWGYVMPSKIYGCIASGRPTLFIGPAESDIHALLSSDKRSASVRNGDVESAFDALETLAALRTKSQPSVEYVA